MTRRGWPGEVRCVRRGEASRGGAGTAWRSRAWRGLSWLGWVGRGQARHSKAGWAWPGWASWGTARRGRRGWAWRARQGGVRRCWSRRRRRGLARLGAAVRAGMACLGMERRGRRGKTRCGGSRHDMAQQAWRSWFCRGEVRHGEVWRGQSHLRCRLVRLLRRSTRQANGKWQLELLHHLLLLGALVEDVLVFLAHQLGDLDLVGR